MASRGLARAQTARASRFFLRCRFRSSLRRIQCSGELSRALRWLPDTFWRLCVPCGCLSRSRGPFPFRSISVSYDRRHVWAVFQTSADAQTVQAAAARAPPDVALRLSPSHGPAIAPVRVTPEAASDAARIARDIAQVGGGARSGTARTM